MRTEQTHMEQAAPERTTRDWRAIAPELVLAALVLIWASTFIITKEELKVFTPFSFIFARMSLVSALALAVLGVRSARRGGRRMWRVDRADLPRFLAAGLCGYAFYQFGFAVGLDHTSPFSSSLLIAMMPLFTLLIAAGLGERTPGGAWLGVVVALVGIVIFLLDQTGGGTLLGNGLSAGAAVAFAMYGLVNRPLVKKYPAATVAAYTTVIGTVPLLLLGSGDALAQDWAALAPKHWLMLVYMAVFPIYLVYIGYNWAISQRGITATSAGLVVPIVSGVLSAIIFGEAFGAIKVVGALLVLAGLVVIQRARMRAARRERAAAAKRAMTGAGAT